MNNKPLTAADAGNIRAEARLFYAAGGFHMTLGERIKFWWFRRKAFSYILKSSRTGVNRTNVPQYNLKFKHILAKELRELGYKVNFSDWRSEFGVQWW